MNKLMCTITFLILIIFHISLYSQVGLKLEPSQLTFHTTAPPNSYDANSEIRISIYSPETCWAISCAFEYLSSAESSIPPERIFISKEGEEDFQAMTGSYFIGEGEPLGLATDPENQFQEITTLRFKIDILQSDLPGSYQGAIKFFNAYDESQKAITILPVSFEINESMNFQIINNDDITINVSGMPGIYQAYEGDNITISVTGNTPNWVLMSSYYISYRKDENNNYLPCNYLNGNNFYIFSSSQNSTGNEGAGTGYKHLGYVREIMNGTSGSDQWSSLLEFKIKTTWEIPPGKYNTKLKIDSKEPEFQDPKFVNLNIEICEYLAIELSENEIYIKSDGPEGDYEADRDIILKIASNTSNWEARAHGESLVSGTYEIPVDRLYVYSSARKENGFMTLDLDQVVASGSSTELDEVSNIKIKAKTTWKDKAGDYSGKVYFTVIALP